MNLKAAIEEVKKLPGFVTYKHRAEDHKGAVQCYSFWFEKDGLLKDYEVRFLVQFKDTVNEEARCYGTSHIVQATPFKDEVAEALSNFVSSHDDYICSAIVSCNEAAETAIVSAFHVDSEGLAQQVHAIVCKKDGQMVFKLLKSYGG